MESEQDDDDDDSMLMLAPTHAHAGTHDIEDDRPDDVLRRRPRGGDASASRENTLGLRLSSCDPRTVGSGIRQTLPADMKHGWRGSVEFREPITQTQEAMQLQSCGQCGLCGVRVGGARILGPPVLGIDGTQNVHSFKSSSSAAQPAPDLSWKPCRRFAACLECSAPIPRGRSIQHEGGAANSVEL